MPCTIRCNALNKLFILILICSYSEGDKKVGAKDDRNTEIVADEKNEVIFNNYISRRKHVNVCLTSWKRNCISRS